MFMHVLQDGNWYGAVDTQEQIARCEVNNRPWIVLVTGQMVFAKYNDLSTLV